jgi:hypothetical protein
LACCRQGTKAALGAQAGGQRFCDTPAMAGLLFRLIRILRRKYQKRQQGR